MHDLSGTAAAFTAALLLFMGGLIATAGLIATPDAFAQALKTGPQVLTFYSTVDDSEQPYAIYLPETFDESRAYPLVISLHGAGSNHRLNLRRVFGKSNAEGENDVEASRYFPEWEDVDYIVASPYARGTMGYQGVAEKDVMNVLDDVKSRFRIDEDRVYLTGLSMGGGGTLWLALTRPDIWAAIAPVCPAPPGGTQELAGNALNVPVHIFHGSDDPVVSPESVRGWVERLESLGTHVEYEEYPGVGHNSWEDAYADGQIFDWFGRFERNRHPDRVRFSSDRYAYDEAYWVRLDRLTPGSLASIEASVTAPERIDVTTEALDGFTLRIGDHPGIRSESALTVSVDGVEFEVDVADSVSFSKREGVWVAEPTAMHPAAKRPGSEGPMGAAVADRHIYVYGTADEPAEHVADARQKEALTAATWSVYRGPFWGRVMVFPRVVVDRDVRPSDIETSNLVLFGTRETNALIAERADILPMHLNDVSGEYGLAYVYPVDGRYVLVSSGRPWWDFREEGQGPFVNQVPALALTNLPDFILFRGSEMVAQGRFDADWRLSEEDARAIAATRVVEMNGRSVGSE